jgi:hypothetical protein
MSPLCPECGRTGRVRHAPHLLPAPRVTPGYPRFAR